MQSFKLHSLSKLTKKPTTLPETLCCAMLCRFIRGKKRSGFDFQIDLEWHQGSSTADAKEPRGTLKVPSASPDDLDDLICEVSLDAGTGEAAADEAARQAAQKLKQPLQEALEQFLTELRSK